MAVSARVLARFATLCCVLLTLERCWSTELGKASHAALEPEHSAAAAAAHKLHHHSAAASHNRHSEPSMRAWELGEGDPILLEQQAAAKGMTVEHLRLGKEALKQARAVLHAEDDSMDGAAPAKKAPAGNAMPCEGLPAKMCKPCPSGGPPAFCASMLTECGELFCSPMCRRNTWECAITWPGTFVEEAKDKSYETALCAQFVAEGCSKLVQCCPDDALLYDYVENGAFGNMFPRTRFPTPSCAHDPVDEVAEKAVCDACKNNIVPVLKPKKCPYPAVGAAPAARRLLSENEAHAQSTTHTETETQATTTTTTTTTTHARIRHWLASTTEGKSEEEIRTAGRASHAKMSALLLEIDALADAADKQTEEFFGPPAFKSLKERCDELGTIISGKLSGWATQFKSTACNCAGCCKPFTCYYPVLDTVEM